MNSTASNTPQSSSSLDDILAELESRFGSSDNKQSKKKSSKKKSFLSSAQSFYAALGLVLLIVGAGVATFLTQKSQELRQQASTLYPNCLNSSNGDPCYNHPDLTGCTTTLGQPGICRVNDADGICSCIPQSGDIICCNLSGTFSHLDKTRCSDFGGQEVNEDYCGGRCDGYQTDSECIGRTVGSNCGPGGYGKCGGPNDGGSACGCVDWCDRSTSQACADVVAGTECGNKGFCVVIQYDAANSDCQCVEPPTSSPSIIISQPPSTATPTPGQGGDPTNTPVPPTNTPRPTNTSTPRPTNTPTATPSNTPTATPTNTPTNTPTFTPSATPTATSTPEPIATPAPLCLNITMTNPFRGDGEPTQRGDVVTFTCGEVSFAQKYEFRIQLPDGTMTTLNSVPAGSRVSEPFTLDQTGQYKAQCRICNDADGFYCGEWEAL